MFVSSKSFESTPNTAEAWNLHQAASVNQRIACVRHAITTWSKETHRNSKILIDNLKLDLDAAMESDSLDTTAIEIITNELKLAYKAEEAFWKQRSRILWLSLGDKNTGYFHAIAKGRKALNKFSVIEDEENQAVFRDDEIAQVIERYFQTIFTSQESDPSEVINAGLISKISAEMNSSLIADPSREEIRAALFSIHPDKAPGPDGFSASFFQTNWSTVGNDLAQEIQQFFTTGNLPISSNETHIRLIPKIHAPRKVSEYRPIALCSVYYKVIAKLISRRLQAILPELISENQSAFVPKRAISDNVLITHEVLHYLKTSSAKRFCSMAVKTDMSKAYDRIEWRFIQQALEKIGFHSKFVRWIMQCITTVSYSFLVNGSPRGRVVPSRGIRQGDPISPYIFILCSEILSGLCSKAQVEGRLKGVRIARSSPWINHLLFADDTMFFCRTDQSSVSTLKSIVSVYEQASGQAINHQKSSITFSRKTPQFERERVKAELGIEKEGGVGKYLGLPEHFGKRKRDLFTSIVDRIRQRAISWSSKLLSTAGKLTLLKSVLTAIPTYAMSCFQLPLSLCKRIQSALTRFWWDSKPGTRKMAWNSWEDLSRAKNQGGLGFRDIQRFNIALLAKISWRILISPTCLMARILCGKYCANTSFLKASCPSSASHGWRGILLGKELLTSHLGWAVGDGKNINIWSEAWLSTTIKEVPQGPPNEAHQELKVSDLMFENSTDWDIDKIREILPEYLHKIVSIKPSKKGAGDKLVWLKHKSGSYSVKSGYHASEDQIPRLPTTQSLPTNWNKDVWNLSLPPKLKLFIWKAMKNSLPVGERLLARKIQTESSCIRCEDTETLCHLLLHCPLAASVWEMAPFVKRPSVASWSDFPTAWSHLKYLCLLPPTGITSSSLAAWICWELWKARNDLVFNDKIIKADDIISKALRNAREWSQAQTTTTSRQTRPLQHISSTHDSVYCRTDAAWREDLSVAGLGWIFLDSRQRITSQHSTAKPFVRSPLIAEGLAAREALTEAVSRGHRSIIFESDSQQLVTAITTKQAPLELFGIVADILILANHFLSFSFRFISRNLNTVADSMAKEALLCFMSSSVAVTD